MNFYIIFYVFKLCENHAKAERPQYACVKPKKSSVSYQALFSLTVLVNITCNSVNEYSQLCK